MPFLCIHAGGSKLCPTNRPPQACPGEAAHKHNTKIGCGVFSYVFPGRTRLITKKREIGYVSMIVDRSANSIVVALITLLKLHPHAKYLFLASRDLKILQKTWPTEGAVLQIVGGR